MISLGDYNTILSDRSLFNQVVYTPLSEALALLEARKNDMELRKKVTALLKDDIPEMFKGEKKCAVQFRQIATPNVDGRNFLALAESANLQPVFFEYHEDKFSSNNNFKHSLGQLRLHHGMSKNGDFRMEKVTVVDFNKHGGDKLKDVATLWAEPLIDFHRRLFDVHSIDTSNICFYEASNWFKRNGEKAMHYYSNFFLLFTCYGILFENFLTNGEEGEFSKNIVLPAIERVMQETGVKPLIVPIPPMDMEEEDYWISYNPKVKELLRS